MSEHINKPARAIAILDTQKEVDDLEKEVASVFLETWPDWVFTKAIQTNQQGPNGEKYVRISNLVATTLGVFDDQETGKRRGPPAQARVSSEIRDKVTDKLQSFPKEWEESIT